MLQSRKVSPGILAKTCENLYTAFAKVAEKIVKYFDDLSKNKRKASTQEDDDGGSGGSGKGVSRSSLSC